MSVPTHLALLLIAAYQRWISPRKGFRCAHSVLHGGTGCSGYAKQALREHGFWSALGLVRQRLRDCRSALGELVAQQEVDEDMPGKADPPRKRKKKDGFFNWTDAAECGLGGCGTCMGKKERAVSAGIDAKAGMCSGLAAGLAETKLGMCGGIAGGFSCCG